MDGKESSEGDAAKEGSHHAGGNKIIMEERERDYCFKLIDKGSAGNICRACCVGEGLKIPE